MPRHAVFVCLLLLLSGCGTVGVSSKEPDVLLTQDETAFAEALAHYAMGLIYHNQLDKKSPDTLEQFLAAAKLDPEEHRTYVHAALCYLSQGLHDKAIETFKKSCDQNPRDPNRHRDMAEASRIIGNIDVAAKHYATAIKLSPDRTELYLALAQILFDKKNDSEAIRYLTKALRNDNDLIVLTMAGSYGRKLIMEGENDRAIALFQKLIQIAPNEPRAYISLASLLFQKNRDAEAIRILRKGLKKCDQMPLLAFCYGQGHAFMENAEEADRSVPCFQLIAQYASSQYPHLYEL
ncbi:MAG: tetratricopeptide repeat protein, partial [Lentisphaerae bacterium]|nr:tetratricopeptide repeat protein [Lentisphaerota bacterium]